MKAKKVETFKDKYFTTNVYEYRGCKYEVTYANGWQVCCSPAHIQHKDAQAEIDEMLDNPKKLEQVSPINLDEIWEMMGW
ncbi:MAG: hypothetical protein IIY21_25580 [Clostridiales bacterium]|nr:hypothetical protein [Clostridiales bacterium]